MIMIICDICGNEMKDIDKYQFELYPMRNDRRVTYFCDVCKDCANDLFNYIDTMRKTARVKLSLLDKQNKT